MNISLIIFIVLFIVVWLMHKPFDIHNSNKVGLKRFHEYLEIALIVQFMIVLNNFFINI